MHQGESREFNLAEESGEPWKEGSKELIVPFEKFRYAQFVALTQGNLPHYVGEPQSGVASVWGLAPRSRLVRLIPTLPTSVA